MCTVWALHVVVINCGGYVFLITCTYYNHSCYSRSGPLNVKTIEQSLKRNGPLDAQGIEMRGGGDGAVWIWPGTKCVRGFDRAGATIYFGHPLRPPQILKRNRPLDVQGIEQILKKDSDIAIVLNVHLARRKELRSLKSMSYLYNLPLISRWITSHAIRLIIGYE